MRFDPFKYIEVQPNVEIEVKKGWLRLRASQPGALYITIQGFEALAGLGSDFALELPENGTARLDAPDATRVFIEEHQPTSYTTSEPVFTNIDRMPDESGSMLEVKRALRQLEFQRRQINAQVREASEMLALQKAALQQPPAVPLAPPTGDEEAAQ